MHRHLTRSAISELFWQRFCAVTGVDSATEDAHKDFLVETQSYASMVHGWLSEVCDGCAVLDSLEKTK